MFRPRPSRTNSATIAMTCAKNGPSREREEQDDASRQDRQGRHDERAAGRSAARRPAASAWCARTSTTIAKVPKKTMSAPGDGQALRREEEAGQVRDRREVQHRRPQQARRTGRRRPACRGSRGAGSGRYGQPDHDAGDRTGDRADHDREPRSGDAHPVRQQCVQVRRGIQEDRPQMSTTEPSSTRPVRKAPDDRADQGAATIGLTRDVADEAVGRRGTPPAREGDQQGGLAELDDADDERTLGEDRHDADEAQVDGDGAADDADPQQLAEVPAGRADRAIRQAAAVRGSAPVLTSTPNVALMLGSSSRAHRGCPMVGRRGPGPAS